MIRRSLYTRISRSFTTMAVFWVKAFHIALFLVGTALVFHIIYAGVVDRITRLTRVAIWIMTFESVVLVLNGGRCPLTVLAEKLGAERGSITHIILPDWIAPHVFTIAGVLFVLGLTLVSFRLVRSARAATA